MSHIDSFKHELVGLFGGLPVYHPLEVIDGDFRCDPTQLLLGGGSGEHPALVLKDPTAAVAGFVSECLDEVARDARERWGAVIEPYNHWRPSDVLEFFAWDVATHARFYDLCRSHALPNPWFEDSQESIERWLVLGFGEFVFYAMPALAPAIMGELHDATAHFKHVRYNNILLVPPNMPVYANGGNAFGR